MRTGEAGGRGGQGGRARCRRPVGRRARVGALRWGGEEGGECRGGVVAGTVVGWGVGVLVGRDVFRQWRCRWCSGREGFFFSVTGTTEICPRSLGGALTIW